MCHLLSIPGLGGETFGKIAGEITDENDSPFGYSVFLRLQQAFQQTFQQATQRCQGVLLDQKTVFEEHPARFPDVPTGHDKLLSVALGDGCVLLV